MALNYMTLSQFDSEAEETESLSGQNHILFLFCSLEAGSEFTVFLW